MTAMYLAKAVQSNIEKAAREAGLALAAEQACDIAEAEAICVADSRRVSFGESASVRIIHAFAESPYVEGRTTAASIVQLVESFYDLREDHPARITDDEIVESLREALDGDAAGDAGLATMLARESLSGRWGSSPYAIADDDGNVYRWDPEEWRDDVTADGWCGERWEDVDE